MWAAENPQIDGMSYHETTFPMGADRAAAAALPLLLLAPFDNLNLDRPRIESALRCPCDQSLRRGSRDLRQGLRATFGRRPASLTTARGSLPPTRAGLVGRDGRLARLQARPMEPRDSAVASRIPCRRLSARRCSPSPTTNCWSTGCACRWHAWSTPGACRVSGTRWTALWKPLWDCLPPRLAHWWKEGYDHHAQSIHEPIARRMIEIALDGERDLLKAFIETFAANSNALHLLFDGFATVFTYDEDSRQSIDEFWPWALEIALDAVGDGSDLRSEHHWFDYMTAALLPTPSPHSWDPDIDGTFSRARENWIQPDALGRLPNDGFSSHGGNRRQSMPSSSSARARHGRGNRRWRWRGSRRSSTVATT